MVEVMDEKEHYVAAFSRLEKELTAGDPPTLHRLRRGAIARFAELGFPTLDDEEYRFTNLAPLKQASFEPGVYAATSSGREPPAFVDVGGTRLLCVDGHRPLLTGASLPSGVVLGSLKEAWAAHPNLIEPHFARLADHEQHTFTALNTAFVREGVFLYVPRNVVVERPLHVRFFTTASDRPRAWQRRVLIVMESNSQAQLLEEYDGVDDVYFTNAVTEVVLRENAVLDHYRLQREGRQAFHFSLQQTRQERGSNFRSHAVTLGGSLVRNEVNAVLAAEGCECTLNGLYLASGRQHVDNRTRIDHAMPHGASHELYKGILDGQAHGVFNGQIYVHPDAQKTDAKQTNKTLLLSKDAVINSKPQLEIYADDVKCTHGATIGQLAEEAIFYLRSRGIGRDDARSLLTFAFANDVVSRIRLEPLRARLEDLLLGRRPAPELPEDQEAV